MSACVSGKDTARHVEVPDRAPQPANDISEDAMDTTTEITMTDLLGPDAPATLTVPQAGRLLGVSRGAAYRAVETGELPTIRIGRRLLVPVGRLLTILGAGGTPDR